MSVPLYNLVLKGYETLPPYCVSWQPDYGPVCSAWTTNGSIAYVARMTAEHVASGQWTVTDARIEADFTNIQSIIDALKAFRAQL